MDIDYEILFNFAICIPDTRGDFIFKKHKRVFVNTLKENRFTDRHNYQSYYANYGSKLIPINV